MLRFRVGLIAAALSVVGFGQPVAADIGASHEVGESGGELRASVSRGEREGSSGSGCSWASVDESGGTGDGRASGAQTTASADGLTTLALYRRVCTSGTSLVWVPLVTATDLLPALRDEMVRRLHHPAPVFEPFDDELGWVYVSVPIDVRTEAATWEPIVLTASIDGPPGLAPWVTLTATPVELLFSSGDPTDPGVVARCGGDAAVAAYVADAPGACSYTWYNASTTVAGDVFAAEMGIAWEVTYASSDGPGSLDVEPTVTPVPVQVAEIKALVTCTGPDPAQGGC